MSCSALHCSASPCGRPARFILADRAEVPLECPNRVELADPAWQLFRLLAEVDTYVTPRAASVVGRHPVGGALDNVFEMAVAGELVLLETVVRPQLRIGKFAGEPEEPPGPGPGPRPPPERATWIKFRVVDDQSGEPLAGVRLLIRESDESEREYVTRSDGMAEIDPVRPSACDVLRVTYEDQLEVVRVE